MALESYPPDNTDFAEQIKKMIGLYYRIPRSLVEKRIEMRPPEQEESEIFPEKPEPIIDFEAVFIPDNFHKVAMIAPQFAYYDVLDVQFIGTSLWQSPQLLELAGDYVENAIFPSGFFSQIDNPQVSAFTDNFHTSFDTKPGVLAAMGYDTIGLLKRITVLEHVKTRKGLQNALFNTTDYSGLFGLLSFDSEGEVNQRPLLLTVKDRRMVEYR